MLTTVARFIEVTESGDRPILPPPHVVEAVHVQGAWEGVRPLVGVLEAPALRVDGSLVQTPGYDARTGHLFEPSIDFGEVSEAPTQDDARRAREELEEVFVDFPFRDPVARAVPLAALLTLVARPAIRGSVPAFLTEANTRGSGKTLATDAIATIATGRASGKMSWPPDDAELEKILGAYALRGATLINFDNIVRPFGGAPLDRCLTAVDTVELRILGKTDVPELPWRAVVFGTGNNLQIAGDTARRVLVGRLESPLENPEERTGFLHPNLLAWVTEHRARLVRAALTILRAWVVAGRPVGECSTWGSFEAWSAMIPPALVFAGGADPMHARAERAGVEDVGKTALAVILDHWSRLNADGKGLTTRAALEVLYPARREPGPPDGFDDLRDAIESMVPVRDGRAPDTRKVGEMFRSFRRRNVGGRCLDVASEDRKKTARWAVTSC